jgi:hypothetical protein
VLPTTHALLKRAIQSRDAWKWQARARVREKDGVEKRSRISSPRLYDGVVEVADDAELGRRWRNEHATYGCR